MSSGHLGLAQGGCLYDTENPEVREAFYRQLYLLRRVEERIATIYPTDKIKSPVHLSIGQEAVAVGVAEALRPEDIVSGTYRGHAIYLARGGSLTGMFAELYGKDSGVARGKGGSMHLVDMSHHILGTSAVVGTTVPIAVGYALAQKALRTDHVVVAFFGDGATEEGAFYESLNFAALRRLPVLFVGENNFLAIHEPIAKRQATDRLVERVRTYGMPAEQVTSGDVFEIHAQARALLEGVRAGRGPAFLECHTYRWREHVGPGEDYDAGYRSRAELAVWQAKDPLARLAGELPAGRRRAIEDEIDRGIEAAVAFAEAADEPAARELLQHVYAR
jgi:TPP-dependent pyruvate/acetoin dehydrogenase alpha subunit